MIYIKTQHENLGVTLLELLFVIAIMGVLSIVVVQRMNRYTMDSHVDTIQTSVKTLFDLMDQYYFSACSGNTLNRKKGSVTYLNKNSFIDSDLISESAYDERVVDPFAQGSGVYSFNLQYLQKTNSTNRIGSFWISSVTYYLPTGITNPHAALYARKLNPTFTQNNNHILTWQQTVTTRIQGQGGVLSPIGNDIKRFTIQQYVPILGLGSNPNNKLYDQDYDNRYRPPDSVDSCEVYEEQYLSGRQFKQKRAIH